MPKKRKSFNSQLALLGLILTPGAQAFDVGYEKGDSKHFLSFKLEAIIERYYRTLQAPTSSIADAWYTEGLTAEVIKANRDNFTKEPYLTGELHAYNLVLRPTLNIDNKVTGYVDFAVLDDVRTSSAPPYMLGVGGNASREIYPGIVASLFGSVHMTESYRYKLELGTEDFKNYEKAEFEGRMLIGSAGAMIGLELDLPDIDIFPYAGIENSLHRSYATIKTLCPLRGCQVDQLDKKQNYNIVLNEEDFIYLVGGITLRRPNETTMRIEGHVSKTDWNFSGALGIKF